MATVTSLSTIKPFSPDFLSLEELAARMGISVSLAYQLARADKLPVPAIRPGRRFLFSRRAYERLLDAQHTQTVG
jgi:excisionase family DNA binding protein